MKRYILTILCIGILLAGCSKSSEPESSAPSLTLQEGTLSVPSSSSSRQPEESLKGDSSNRLPDYVKPGQWAFDIVTSEPPIPESSKSSNDADTASGVSEESASSEPESEVFEEYGIKYSISDEYAYYTLQSSEDSEYVMPIPKDLVLQEPTAENDETHYTFSTESFEVEVYFRNPKSFGPGVTLKYLIDTNTNQIKQNYPKDVVQLSGSGIITNTGAMTSSVLYSPIPGNCELYIVFGNQQSRTAWLCGTIKVSDKISNTEFLDSLYDYLDTLGLLETRTKVSGILDGLRLDVPEEISSVSEPVEASE